MFEGLLVGDACILLLLEGEEPKPFVLPTGAVDAICGVLLGAPAGLPVPKVIGTVLHLALRTPFSSIMYPFS